MITNAEEGRILGESALLGNVDLKRLRLLAFASERFVLSDGVALFRAGSEGDDGFLILSGTVEVWVRVKGEDRMLTTTGPGFIAGAGALLRGGGYRATVLAKGPVQVLRIRRPAFLALFEGDQEAMAAMMRFLAERKEKIEATLDIEFD